MSWEKDDLIPATEITDKVTSVTVDFAERFGMYLAEGDKRVAPIPLTTSQLRKFFGEVKRQQMTGYRETDFVMLKPKLAYAVGRAKANEKGKAVKIEDFYWVMADAIDKVNRAANKEVAFKNFITFFEAVVAYHKAWEKK